LALWLSMIAAVGARLAFPALARLDTECVVNAPQRAAPVCQGDFVLSKPGSGSDEGLMILSIEMARTLTLIRNRGRASIELLTRRNRAS
jgi:hypothetical protein